jgi:dTDP-4-amino-4,6-dideoxygalactose transaminase
VQAFTCVAVPNSVIWSGARPVYADIDRTLNIDPVDVARKLTPMTKAIVVQHTFGIPARMDKIVAIAKKNNLIVIEDCAHSLGAAYNGKKIGTVGDGAFFSFGRDKVVSSVWGGAAIIHSKFKEQNLNLKLFQHRLKYPPMPWIAQQLLHPIAFSFILPAYINGLGKAALVVLQKLHVLSFPVYKEEKSGGQPKYFPMKYPNALAALLVNQLGKLDTYNRTRRHSASEYIRHVKGVTGSVGSDSVYLRFPILVKNPKQIISRAKQKGVLLGNWYHNVIDPTGTNVQLAGYTRGSCPYAEHIATHIINFPTLVSDTDVRKVLSVLGTNDTI